MNLRKTGILLAWAMIIAANGTAQNVQRTSQGIKYAAQGMNVSVEFYSPSIVRVYKTPGETASDKESLVVIKAPEQTPVSFGENGKKCNIEQSDDTSGSEPRNRRHLLLRQARATAADRQRLRNTVYPFQ